MFKTKIFSRILMFMTVLLISILSVFVATKITSKPNQNLDAETYGYEINYPNQITGGGTASNPYLIYDAWGYNYWASQLYSPYINGSYVKLMQDIDISGYWSLPGDGDTVSGVTFTLDGNYHKLSIFATNNDSTGSGSLGVVAANVWNCTIKNLKVSGTMGAIGTVYYVGGLIGTVINSATIENCFVDLDIIVNTDTSSNHHLYAGGLVGSVGNSNSYTPSITIKDSCFTGSLNVTHSGTTHINHLYGDKHQSMSSMNKTITNSYYNYEQNLNSTQNTYTDISSQSNYVNFHTAYKKYIENDRDFTKYNAFVKGTFVYESDFYYEYDDYYNSCPQLSFLINRNRVNPNKFSIKVNPENKRTIYGDEIYYYIDDWDYDSDWGNSVTVTVESFNDEEELVTNYTCLDNYAYVTEELTGGAGNYTLTITLKHALTVKITKPYLNNREVTSSSIVESILMRDKNGKYVDEVVITAVAELLHFDTSYSYQKNNYELILSGSLMQQVYSITLNSKYELEGWYVQNYYHKIELNDSDNMVDFESLATDYTITIYPVLKLKSYNVIFK